MPTIVPPVPLATDAPLVTFSLNEQWASYVSGMLSLAEFERWWGQSQYHGIQGIMAIQEAMAGGSPVNLANKIVVLADRKPKNTAGGSFTLGAWRQRALTIEMYDPGNLCILGAPGANAFRLDQGHYFVLARCPAYKVASHQARLFDITSGLTAIMGSTAVSAAADAVQSDSVIMGVLDATTNTDYQIEHWSTATQTTNGFGLPGNIDLEFYTMVWLLKLED